MWNDTDTGMLVHILQHRFTAMHKMSVTLTVNQSWKWGITQKEWKKTKTNPASSVTLNNSFNNYNSFKAGRTPCTPLLSISFSMSLGFRKCMDHLKSNEGRCRQTDRHCCMCCTVVSVATSANWWRPKEMFNWQTKNIRSYVFRFMCLTRTHCVFPRGFEYISFHIKHLIQNCALFN